MPLFDKLRNSQPSAESPMGELQAAAIMLHELMTSYMEAGFTRAQAVALVQSHVNASMTDG